MTNEIRSDALDINVYLKKCSDSLTNCSISKNNNDLVADLNLSILKKATKYQKEIIDKNIKETLYNWRYLNKVDRQGKKRNKKINKNREIYYFTCWDSSYLGFRGCSKT